MNERQTRVLAAFFSEAELELLDKALTKYVQEEFTEVERKLPIIDCTRKVIAEAYRLRREENR